ncbi:hypothetical protein AVEN_111379-1 [Araneus ventricosus]|uniref:Uncharacterized protein n=1 Tax=Araneus ventricosus TaxID=182803 RepID=A0A4Y2WQ66_ARAVE|nr:hypothetical protein AVEN_111379-1 [Araneus ventricosus]
MRSSSGSHQDAVSQFTSASKMDTQRPNLWYHLREQVASNVARQIHERITVRGTCNKNKSPAANVQTRYFGSQRSRIVLALLVRLAFCLSVPDSVFCSASPFNVVESRAYVCKTPRLHLLV